MNNLEVSGVEPLFPVSASSKIHERPSSQWFTNNARPWKCLDEAGYLQFCYWVRGSQNRPPTGETQVFNTNQFLQHKTAPRIFRNTEPIQSREPARRHAQLYEIDWVGLQGNRHCTRIFLLRV